jgi:hypothetical protein
MQACAVPRGGPTSVRLSWREHESARRHEPFAALGGRAGRRRDRSGALIDDEVTARNDNKWRLAVTMSRRSERKRGCTSSRAARAAADQSTSPILRPYAMLACRKPCLEPQS